MHLINLSKLLLVVQTSPSLGERKNYWTSKTESLFTWQITVHKQPFKLLHSSKHSLYQYHLYFSVIRLRWRRMAHVQGSNFYKRKPLTWYLINIQRKREVKKKLPRRWGWGWGHRKKRLFFIIPFFIWHFYQTFSSRHGGIFSNMISMFSPAVVENKCFSPTFYCFD